MSSSMDTAAFDRGTDPILQFFTVGQARALVAYRGDEAIRARIEELAERSTEGDLTEAELAEYEGYIEANDFIATLQAKARKILDRL
jgi:selenocysteine lyase/cysteine desulfurase